MHWLLSDRADPVARVLADRHYNRQKVGARQFVPPGRCLVLKSVRGDAFWITSYPFAAYVRHRWAGAWVCSAFRNEGPLLSSSLIEDALAATVERWPPPRIPTWVVSRRLHDRTLVERIECAMVTFIDETKTRSKRDPGRCYRRAGFEEAGRTAGGLLALVLRTDRVPAARPALTLQCAMGLQ